MGILRQEEINAMEISVIETKTTTAFDGDETVEREDGSSVSTSTSSVDKTCSNHILNDESEVSQYPSARKVVVEIPPYWIYGALPTDKEYGRWIRSQLSEKVSDEEKYATNKSRRKLHHHVTTQDSINNGNPWKQLQCAIAEGFTKTIKEVGIDETTSANSLELTSLTS
ncbi:hypothetical protein IV203_027850 [Nitzschia inconspicua]|uniref:Uncharacterized protein n=1 Tax=Nitzschia inconspicua TaxID=303405 RepID=A0A9K3LXS4_9STRA|nr:hypothetical protein IV203_027850 [Nitzschia inconspicua]